MRLDGHEFEKLWNVLADAFVDTDELDRMVRFRLNKRPARILASKKLDQRVYELIEKMEADDRIEDLVTAAREYKHRNADLISFSTRFGLTSASLEIQRIVSEGGGFEDPDVWRAKLGELETRVCQIEIPVTATKSIFGTGFLVAKDVVLTNHHVMEPVINRQIESSRVIFRFDRKQLYDAERDQLGTVTNQGVEYGLVEDDNPVECERPKWLIHDSEMSPLDEQVDPPQDPEEDELDYALLRVDGEPGNEAVGGANGDLEAPRRGWITVPEPGVELVPDTLFFILQHPDGRPLKMAPPGPILAINGNGTRVRHKVNTIGGSSGSPCFDFALNLAAIHHAGDPNFERKATYNQAVPVQAILGLLRKKGLDQVLGG